MDPKQVFLTIWRNPVGIEFCSDQVIVAPVVHFKIFNLSQHSYITSNNQKRGMNVVALVNRF